MLVGRYKLGRDILELVKGEETKHHEVCAKKKGYRRGWWRLVLLAAAHIGIASCASKSRIQSILESSVE